MKNKYLIDGANRLVIKQKRRRLVTQGRFALDKNNQLIYWLNEPSAWRRLYGLPNKISFQGNWRLNPNYDLEFMLNKTKNQYKGECLALKGEIISVDRDTLVFEVESLDKEGLLHIQILKLSGLWQADEYNQISFEVEKKTLPDILTLKGSWQLNKNQQIIYTFEKTGLKRKTKVIKTLTFEGFWQINHTNRLTYILSRSTKSCFDFRVQLESPNLYPKEGLIKYRLGIGLKGRLKGLIPKKGTVPTKIISLYGIWKFSRRLGLIFQMDYGSNKIQNIEFGMDIALSKKDEITFSLKNKRGEPLGLSIKFTHRFLNKLDAQAFLRLKENIRKESAIEAGVRIPF